MESSLHKWDYNAFICNNQRSEYTVGSGTIWNTQEHDVLCLSFIAVDKYTYAIYCTYHWLYTGHLARNSSSRPLAVTKTGCDDVDIGLDYTLHSQRTPDSEAGSMENVMRADKIPNIWCLAGNYFCKIWSAAMVYQLPFRLLLTP
jgi:hypothetical protein